MTVTGRIHHWKSLKCEISLTFLAAHCFHAADPRLTPNFDITNYAIAAGKYYRDYDSSKEPIGAVIEKRRLIAIWIHPEYKGRERNYYRDISILTMESFVPFSDNIRPVCLKFPEEAQRDMMSNQAGRFAAWSQTDSNNLDSTLTAVRMSTLSYAECRQTVLETLQLDLKGDKFCLAPFRDDSFACKGDSGSGFVLNEYGTFYLVGVVSFSPTRTQECSRDKLLVMTNVLYYSKQLDEMKFNDIQNDII